MQYTGGDSIGWQRSSREIKISLTLFLSILFVLLATVLAVLVAHYFFHASILALAAALGVSGVILPLVLVGLVAALIAFEIPSLWNMELLEVLYGTWLSPYSVKPFLRGMAIIALIGGAGLGLIIAAATPVLLSFLAGFLGVVGAYVVMAVATALLLAGVVALLGIISFKRGKTERLGYFYIESDQRGYARSLSEPSSPSNGKKDPERVQFASKVALAGSTGLKEHNKESLFQKTDKQAEEIIHPSPIGIGRREEVDEGGVDVGNGWKFYKYDKDDYFWPGELRKDGQPVWKIYRTDSADNTKNSKEGELYYHYQIDQEGEIISTWDPPDGIKDSSIDTVTRDILKPLVVDQVGITV